MKKKLIIILSAIALTAVIGGAAIAYAAPESELERGLGNCLGWGDAESFEEFQQQKIDRIEDLVDEGTLTQDEADDIIGQIESCDGTGANRPEEGRGIFGRGQGQRNGTCGGGGCRR